MSTIQIQKQVPKHHKFAEILRNTTYEQIRHLNGDGKNGRCAVGVLMSAEGWDGSKDKHLKEIYEAKVKNQIDQVTFSGIWLRNDARQQMTFSQIADWLDSL